MVDVPLAPTPAGVDPEVWDAACGAVRGYCEWHIAPSTHEEVEAEGGGGLLLLPSLHVTDVTAASDEDGNVVTGWKRPRRNGILRGPWRDGAVYFATITHGLDSCPPEVLAIVSDLAKAAAIPVGASTVQAGPFSQTFGSYSPGVLAGVVGLSSLQKQVLDRYKLPPRP